MTFEQWLQSRLTAHGIDVAPGPWGADDVHALKEFQRRRRLPTSGVADEGTVTALKKQARRTSANDMPIPTPAKRMPPWLSEATRKLGLHEVHDNSMLIRFLRIGKYLGNPKSLPWCGDFVESCIERTIGGRVPENPFLAINWRDYPRVAPICGAIAVIQWRRGKSAGHVGFVIDVRRDRNGKLTAVKLRGGNQGNMVKDAWFSVSRMYKIDFVWPPNVPVERYPYIKGRAAVGGGLGGTR